VADLPSPFLPHTITQGRIERFLLDAIEGLSDSALQIERGTEVTSFDYEPSLESAANSHPLNLTLRTLSGDEADPLPPVFLVDATSLLKAICHVTNCHESSDVKERQVASKSSKQNT
jgi:hypothetical protein